MTLPSSALLAERHARIRESLETLNLEALLVTALNNIRYLSNHVGSAGVLVVTRSAMHLVIDFRYEESVQALQASAAACPGLVTWKVPGSYDESVLNCLKETGVSIAGFEAGHLTVARHAWFRDAIA